MSKWMAIMTLVFIVGCGKADEASHKNDEKPVLSPADRAKDPVCGMEVQKLKAKHAAFDNADVFLCSDDCLKKFNAEPTKYLKLCSCTKSKPQCDCGHCMKKCVPCACR